jgi:hypothetical protein
VGGLPASRFLFLFFSQSLFDINFISVKLHDGKKVKQCRRQLSDTKVTAMLELPWCQSKMLLFLGFDWTIEEIERTELRPEYVGREGLGY